MHARGTGTVSPLSEFGRFAADFFNVYAIIAKFALAAPLLDLVMNSGSPWPSRVGVSLALVMVQILIIMCSFAVWRQGAGKIYGIKRWLVFSTVGFVAFFVLVYIPLFAFFVVPAKDYRHAVVRGYELRGPMKEFIAREEAKGDAWPPKVLIACFVDSKHDETSIWTPESVYVMRAAVLGCWLIVGVLYAIPVSAFVAIQYRRIR